MWRPVASLPWQLVNVIVNYTKKSRRATRSSESRRETCVQRVEIELLEVWEVEHINEHGRRAIERRTSTQTHTRHGTGSLGHRVNGSFGSSFTSGSPSHHFDPV